MLDKEELVVALGIKLYDVVQRPVRKTARFLNGRSGRYAEDLARMVLA